MTDPRRLPVLTVSLLEYGNGELFVSNAHVKGGRHSVYTVPSAVVAEYEPAIPRCATCGNFDTSAVFPDARVCLLSGRLLPGDGSGYCHEHPEAKP